MPAKRYTPTERTLRRVWKVVSDNPHASFDEIASAVRTGFRGFTGTASKTTISRSLDELQRRGVLIRQPKTRRSIVLIEPFSWFDAS